MQPYKLEEYPYRELEEIVHKEGIDTIILPVGTIEPHGTHLPLGTDSYIPIAMGQYVAGKLKALLLPPIHYGVTTSLHGYFGSVRIKPETLEELVYEILESMKIHGFKYALILNGHGGNTQALESAAKRAWLNLKMAVMVVDWWTLARERGVTQRILGKSGGHAATDETAMMLAINPGLVKKNLYDSNALCTYSSGVKAFPTPGTIINYSEEEGEVEFKEASAREYFEAVSELILCLFTEFKDRAAQLTQRTCP
jgi:creatinine amidohydrolase